MEDEEFERICVNCMHFFPPNPEDLTYGICFQNAVFEPYIEELIDNNNYEICRDLIEQNKILAEAPACSSFEEPERIEIDPESHLGKELNRQQSQDELDIEALKAAFLRDEVEKIDRKTLPMAQYASQLKSSSKRKQLSALETLGFFARQKDQKAFELILNYFQDLPLPVTVDAVHFKIEVFMTVKSLRNKSAIIPPLINELHRIESNNTTRQWISEI